MGGDLVNSKGEREICLTSWILTCKLIITEPFSIQIKIHEHEKQPFAKLGKNFLICLAIDSIIYHYGIENTVIIKILSVDLRNYTTCLGRYLPEKFCASKDYFLYCDAHRTIEEVPWHELGAQQLSDSAPQEKWPRLLKSTAVPLRLVDTLVLKGKMKPIWLMNFQTTNKNWIKKCSKLSLINYMTSAWMGAISC